MYSIEKFIKKIGGEKPEKFGISKNLYAGKSKESKIRKHNLKIYLHQMKSLNPKLMLLGEAPGYRGCAITGIPFTSQKILTTNPFFKALDFKFINDNQVTEQSSTMVWSVLQNFDHKPLIWNIFPFHPHQENDTSTNRTPNEQELDLGNVYLEILLDIFNIKIIAAVGRKAESRLMGAKVNHQYVRHPSNGGKMQFVKGITKMNQQLGV